MRLEYPMVSWSELRPTAIWRPRLVQIPVSMTLRDHLGVDGSKSVWMKNGRNPIHAVPACLESRHGLDLMRAVRQGFG